MKLIFAVISVHQVAVCGSVAYVSQTAWIQSGTVRDNILFGKPMDGEEYERAVRCCALDKDIENFPHGDLTEIGQRGLNMSGGQKQRIQLARAVYSDADVYLLDDPFSAVDAHTAATLFNVSILLTQFHGCSLILDDRFMDVTVALSLKDCVMAALEEKTVILVTHQVEFLSKVDRILVGLLSAQYSLLTLFKKLIQEKFMVLLSSSKLFSFP
jgi:ABC-type bacteriocin/lantibiotic exporter with double-glycine peptidase domain